ncbi:hypothetical protein EUGRSUZ_E03306 [Eucalyptus grandis]|uniref:Uncharacterized protein n=2 Tax=Eucalyptus grandis TaxID=71139 RepID=A0ACC3KYE3_EUCGR|nr:hypothetical protein EUGRSUZ_E03306 [Eucalyptus grandis]
MVTHIIIITSSFEGDMMTSLNGASLTDARVLQMHSPFMPQPKIKTENKPITKQKPVAYHCHCRKIQYKIQVQV